MSGSGREQASSAIWVAVGQIELPEKKYFKIGEVAHLVGVEPHVLRYWQTQFPQVRPHKSRSGHRLYRRKDVETLLAVKELLHVQRFTIAGARQALKSAVVHRGDTSIPPVEITDTDLPRYAVEAGDTAFEDDGDLHPDVDGLGLADVDGRATAAEGEVTLEEIEVVALAPDELAAALEDELASRHSATARVDVEVTPDVPLIPAAALTPVGHAGRDVAGRMDFGLVAQSAGREALLDARSELKALIGLLDREDGERRRAPSSSRY